MGTDAGERGSERASERVVCRAEDIQNYGVGSLVRTGLATFGGEWKTRDSKTTYTISAYNHGNSKKNLTEIFHVPSNFIDFRLHVGKLFLM